MLVVSVAQAQYRDFTDTEGRTIRGRVVAFDGKTGMATIERENKRIAKVPLAIFSEADQACIKAWETSQGFSSDRLLKITCACKKIEERKEKEVDDITYTGGDVQKDFVKTVTRIEKSAYEIQFQNMNPAPLQNIRMEYRIYYEQSKMTRDGEKPEPKQLCLEGNMSIPELPPKTKISVTTNPVEIFEEDINPLPVLGGDPRIGGKGDLHGMRARIYMKTATGEEVMREVSQPSSLSEEKFPWK